MGKLIEAAKAASMALGEAEQFTWEAEAKYKGMVLVAAYLNVGQKRSTYEAALQAIGEAVLFESMTVS